MADKSGDTENLHYHCPTCQSPLFSLSRPREHGDHTYSRLEIPVLLQVKTQNCIVCGRLGPKPVTINSEKGLERGVPNLLKTYLGIQPKGIYNAKLCRGCYEKLITIDKKILHIQELFESNEMLKRGELLKEQVPPEVAASIERRFGSQTNVEVNINNTHEVHPTGTSDFEFIEVTPCIDAFSDIPSGSLGVSNKKQTYKSLVRPTPINTVTTSGKSSLPKLLPARPQQSILPDDILGVPSASPRIFVKKKINKGLSDVTPRNTASTSAKSLMSFPSHPRRPENNLSYDFLDMDEDQFSPVPFPSPTSSPGLSGSNMVPGEKEIQDMDEDQFSSVTFPSPTSSPGLSGSNMVPGEKEIQEIPAPKPPPRPVVKPVKRAELKEQLNTKKVIVISPPEHDKLDPSAKNDRIPSPPLTDSGQTVPDAMYEEECSLNDQYTVQPRYVRIKMAMDSFVPIRPRLPAANVPDLTPSLDDHCYSLSQDAFEDLPDDSEGQASNMMKTDFQDCTMDTSDPHES